MKKNLLTAALLAAALVFPFVSCNNSYVESTPETTPEEKEDKTPEEKEEEPPEEEEVKPVPAPGPDFVYVEGTTVEGGDKFTADGNKGVFVKDRTVTIDDFFMCNHEVTQAEFEAVMGVNPSNFSKNPAEGETQENRPVERVSWYAAIAYCNKKSALENLTPCYTINGITDWENFDYSSIPTSSNKDWSDVICDFTANGYRLPTPEEWEYAALGGKKGVEANDPTDWAGTNDISELNKYAWNRDNCGGITHEVMTKDPNLLDLYDMTGNVWEWTWQEGTNQRLGGGSLAQTSSDSMNYIACVLYYSRNSNWKCYDLGFRVARSK